jgi:hypothetical protein
MPRPKKGEQKLFEILRDLNVNAQKTDITESKVVVAFIIDMDGTLTGKRVIRNVKGTNLAEQVLSLIEKIEWEAGSCEGIYVPVIYCLPVHIHLK